MMERNILICIDDTDNIDSIGTGELLENMCGEMERLGLGKGGFVTRHQLFIHEDIEYTSHNSSMCCLGETEDLEKLLPFLRGYLEKNRAEGSDPGLCVYVYGDEDTGELVRYGEMAQERVLTKESAYSLAEKYPGSVFLSEHGGTGDGVIGAIAGVGLRLSGSDGRVKGKIYPEVSGEVLTAAEFCEKYALGQVVSEDGVRIGPDEPIRFEEVTKAVYRDRLTTAVVTKKDGYWVPIPRKKNKK